MVNSFVWFFCEPLLLLMVAVEQLSLTLHVFLQIKIKIFQVHGDGRGLEQVLRVEGVKILFFRENRCFSGRTYIFGWENSGSKKESLSSWLPV